MNSKKGEFPFIISRLGVLCSCVIFDCCVFFCAAGVLDSGGSDFEDGEEVFDAIGGVLQEVAAEKNEDDVRDICLQLFNTLKL